ncbi:hypothetical protein CDL15_Pgr005995 [Punica granatum]|uniref:Uncharacterized protein n=1 Tax=Punica granatum TaxID=22663 RepID=A0A218VTR9_PUNGR|nr:hypothetical protein CDL15_Pgr005995 [Punica granatum]
MDAESWTRSPKSSKNGREVRKAVKRDAKSWTRNSKSSKDGHEVRKTVWLAVCRVIGRMLDDLCRALGGDGLITVFTGEAVACECCHSEAVLWVGLTLGTKTHLVLVESEDCTWLSRRDGHHFLSVDKIASLMPCPYGGAFDLSEADLAAGVVVFRRRPALLLGWLCFAGGSLCPWGGCVSDLPEASLATRAFACYSAGCRLCRRGDCSLLGMPRSSDE